MQRGQNMRYGNSKSIRLCEIRHSLLTLRVKGDGDTQGLCLL